MKFRKHFTPSTLLTVVFVVSLFLLFFIAALSFRQIGNLTQTQKSIAQSLEIRINLEKVFSELKDAESAHRGYLLTKDDRYLAPYNYSQVTINKSLFAIRNLIEGDRLRQKEFDILNTLITQRFRGLRYNLSESRFMETTSDDFRVKLWVGKVNMDSIRKQINKIIEIERKILEQHEREHDNEISITPLMSLLLVAFSLIVFIYTFHRINVSLRKVNMLNATLQYTNDTFNYAEKIGEICHWQFDVATEELTFSDNKFKLLGCLAQSYDPTVDNFLACVHPHDRKKVRNSFKREFTTDTYSVYFRIIKADKKIRHIKSVCKLTQDNKGHEIIVGVDCDVTLQHRNTVKLEQKNAELKGINEELSSFNHIVSHDLQEPLRKIHMFISRIVPEDVAKLSDTSQNFLSRIQSSSSRAQKLIDDLLEYSRLNRTDKKCVLTNLNDIFESAKTDLAQVIEEKAAEIIVDPLPTIKVIPHQIQQVFVNLISNSIKYARLAVAPRVEIQYRIVERRKIAGLGKRSYKRYHEFTFTDNGIGFDQQYADRIFVLFHRLHDNDAYSGTGIGLAICKKMVGNHGGSIVAFGNPASGSQFKVYLPVRRI